MGKRFYSPQEVAQLLDVSPTTVMSRIHAGALPAVRVSERIFRIPVAAFERFVATLQDPAITVEFREVDRVAHLGEEIGAHTDDLVTA